MGKLQPMHYFFLLVLIAVLGIIAARIWQSTLPGKYDELAQCLTEKGAMFYGAFWCPHCQDQKKLFGNSANLLPYTECSTPDGQNRLQVCVDEEIESYPTWKLSDGSVLKGVLKPAELAEAAGCQLPE